MAEQHAGLVDVADVIASIDSVSVAVDGVAQTARLTVNFTVKDADGDYIPHLADPAAPPNQTRPAYIRFALSRLQAAAAQSGDPDIWVNYTIGDRTVANLTDHKDGTYTYLFNTNLYANYVPTERHRLLLIVSGTVVPRAKNVTYDFVPSQLPGPFTFPLSRDIITTAACASCHGRLGSPLGSASFHGGSRYLAEACTVCHTTTLGEGEAELAPMIHAIHAAQDLGDLGDFGEVTYPQDLRNCTKCHAGPDGDHWKTRPSIEACGSCHSSVDFATGANHPGGAQANNRNCALCHPPAGGLSGITDEHVTENSTPNNPLVPPGQANFEYVLEDVTVNENNQAVVKFHINKDGTPLDLKTVYPPAGFSGGPSFLVGYALPQDGITAPVDYNNKGRAAGQPATVTLASLSAALTGTPDSYTAVLVSAPFPAGATLRAVSLQGYFTQLNGAGTADDLGRHTPSVVKAVTGDPVRREVVDIPKCLNCHEILELHGGNRVNNVQVCVICHNPNLSSSGRGAVKRCSVTTSRVCTASTECPQGEECRYLLSSTDRDHLAENGYDPGNSLTYPEATNQFKNMVHGIHASAARTFPYEFVRDRGTSGVFFYDWSEVTFPGILSDCETCHKPGTYDVDLPTGVLATTDVTTDGTNATSAAVVAARASVPNATDLVNSPIASTCYMCHDSNPAAYHFGHNGGVIDTERSEAFRAK